MAKKFKNTMPGWRRYAGLIVVCAIVIGVAILSVTASRQKITQYAVRSTSEVGRNAGPEPAFLVMNSNGLKLRSLDGSRQVDIKWPDDVSHLGKPLSQVQGVDLASGQAVWLDSGFVRASSTAWRSLDGRRNARMAPDKRDGTGSVEITQGNESRILVLRQKNGRKITDEQLLGWLDKDTMALVGIATSTRNIFTLDLNGVLTPIAQLPDDAWLIKVAADHVYYARATPGEGLESPQRAPSSLWKVDSLGRSLQVVQEPLHVIQNMVVGYGAIVYSLDNNQIKIVQSGNITDLSVGRPLMRVAQGTLCSQVGKLVLLKDDGQVISFDGIQPEGAIFYLPEASLK